MTSNETYHKLISELGNAINALQDAFASDRHEGAREMYNLIEYGRDLSWKKCRIIDELLKKGLMHYEIKEEPF